MLLEYSEVDVCILRWPDLKYLANCYMGTHRNSFWWENKKGKLIFYYNQGNFNYRTVFPANFHADTLCFSKAVLVDSVFKNE